jgi:hypothetical protein
LRNGCRRLRKIEHETASQSWLWIPEHEKRALALALTELGSDLLDGAVGRIVGDVLVGRAVAVGGPDATADEGDIRRIVDADCPLLLGGAPEHAAGGCLLLPHAQAAVEVGVSARDEFRIRLPRSERLSQFAAALSSAQVVISTYAD